MALDELLDRAALQLAASRDAVSYLAGLRAAARSDRQVAVAMALNFALPPEVQREAALSVFWETAELLWMLQDREIPAATQLVLASRPVVAGVQFYSSAITDPKAVEAFLTSAVDTIARSPEEKVPVRVLTSWALDERRSRLAGHNLISRLWQCLGTTDHFTQLSTLAEALPGEANQFRTTDPEMYVPVLRWIGRGNWADEATHQWSSELALQVLGVGSSDRGPVPKETRQVVVRASEQWPERLRRQFLVSLCDPGDVTAGDEFDLDMVDPRYAGVARGVLAVARRSSARDEPAPIEVAPVDVGVVLGELSAGTQKWSLKSALAVVTHATAFEDAWAVMPDPASASPAVVRALFQASTDPQFRARCVTVWPALCSEEPAVVLQGLKLGANTWVADLTDEQVWSLGRLLDSRELVGSVPHGWLGRFGLESTAVAHLRVAFADPARLPLLVALGQVDPMLSIDELVHISDATLSG